ncbi:MAG: hypothetical protein ACJA0S_000156 [Rickettsiales bacterium]|jgi:hypothetical protein
MFERVIITAVVLSFKVVSREVVSQVTEKPKPIKALLRASINPRKNLLKIITYNSRSDK